MAKDNLEGISRRDFLGVTIGTAIAAGVGCGGDPKPDANSAGGHLGDGEDGEHTSQGSGGRSAGQGGGSAMGEGGKSADHPGTGGASGRETGTVGGGTSQGQGDTSAAGSARTSQAGGSTRSGDASTRGSGGTRRGGGVDPADGGSGGTISTSGKGGGRAAGGGLGRGGATGDGGLAASGGGGGGSSSQDTALVSLVRGTDWVQATIDAIALAGGLPDLSGKTVLLKPNLISSDKNATTSVDVIHGAVKAAKAKNAAKIIVADAGWGNGSDVMANMKALGIADMCTAEGAEVLDLRTDKHTTRTHANASAFPDGIDFSDAVYNADYVINLPVCKSHGIGKYTMALKAWYGCTEKGRSHGNTWVAPAELHLMRQEEFVVLDATKAMITGGPSTGTMAQSKIVAASKDAIALDVTGICIHKYAGGTLISAKGDAWNIHQIKRALALKFPGWVSSPQKIPYAQQGVTEHTEIMDWCMA